MADETPAAPAEESTEQKVPVANTSDEVAVQEELHAAKLEIVKLLNSKRAEAGVSPLEFDSVVSASADKHCQEMVANGTLSHWDLAGRKPYQRHFEGGSCHHIDERVGGDDAVEGASFDTSSGRALEMMKGLHEDFAKTGEASRALAPGHTHVGIGVALSETHFRYVEVYVARYVEIDSESLTQVKSLDHTIKGKVISGLSNGRSGKWGPIACVVYREPPPTPMSIDDLATLDAYEDFSEQRAAVTWPWQMTFNPEDGSFEFPINFDSLEKGQYYVMLYVREDPDTIPYGEMVEGIAIPGDGFVESTGVMLTYDGPAVQRGGESGSGSGNLVDESLTGTMEAPITSVVVVTQASEPDLVERLVGDGYETRSVGGGAEAATDGLQLYFLKSRDPTLKPVTSLHYVTGNEAELPAPDGMEVLPISIGSGPNIADIPEDGGAANEAKARDDRIAALKNLLNASASSIGSENGDVVNNGVIAELVWESDDMRSSLESVNIDPSAVRAHLETDVESTSTLESLTSLFGDVGTEKSIGSAVLPKPGKYTYLCVGYGTAGEGSDSISDLILCNGGDAREGRNALGTSTMVETLLLPIKGMSISFRRSQALVVEEEDDGFDATMVDDNYDSKMGEEEEEDELFRQRAEEEYKNNVQNEEVRRDQTRINLIRLLREAEQENQSERTKNSALDKQCALYLHSLGSKKTEGKDQEGGQARKSQAELGQNYSATIRVIGDNMARLERDQESYDRESLDLQSRLEEKEEKVESVREAFTNFKTEIAKAAENSRSGKPIPRKIIRQFEETELKKDEDVSKVRLRNINLKTQLKKLEGKLREKEQLADGLHLIDFEQLKIENQTLNEKIEERNEELHKLRKKTTTTVQVLTHIKEKLQFEKAQNEILKSELATLDTELTSERDQLSKSKRARERMRAEGTALQGEQGFVSNDSLVQDYERRKINLREKNAVLIQLQQKHAALIGSINRDTMALNGK